MKVIWNLIILALALLYTAALLFPLLWLGAQVIGPLPLDDFLKSHEKSVQIYSLAAFGVSMTLAFWIAVKTLVLYLHKGRGLPYEAIEKLIGSASFQYGAVRRRRE
jgi:hypothetical protein